MDKSCDLFKRQATRQYRSIGMHLVLINWRVTSSDAVFQTCQKGISGSINRTLSVKTTHLTQIIKINSKQKWCKDGVLANTIRI